MSRTAIVWFRRDLRLADNPALTYALAKTDRIVALSVAPDSAARRAYGAASLEWLELSRQALDASLRQRGARLRVVSGPAPEALAREVARCNATLVACNRDWTPSGMLEERAVGAKLAAAGVELHVSEGQLLVPPGAVTTGSGTPYSVFTPFSRAWRGAWIASAPLPAPERIVGYSAVDEEPLQDALQSPSAATSMAAHWTPGEAGAHERLQAFVDDALATYDTDRDRPALPGTSSLSPHLAWGEITPLQVAAAVNAAHDESIAWPFLRQLAWREFSYHVLHAHPQSLYEPLRSEFSAFPWREDAAGTAAWSAGRTGYPIVDAGMRQLAETGWMHNRVRLVAASFLTKDLLVPWQTGEAVFRERLVDYDPAANAFNWQWVAGSGADAAPYFRVFNPATQGVRFDPDGTYVRRWVPELAALDARWIHRPHLAPSAELLRAGVVMGETYPAPVVDHAEARTRALAALASMRRPR